MSSLSKSSRKLLKRRLQNESLSSLPPFTAANPFVIVLVHRATNTNELHHIIRLAQNLKHFTIDTESDLYTNRPSLIQIEFIGEIQSTVVLIEVEHLPVDKQSLQFWHIRAILKFVLLPSKTIYGWGDAYDELLKFINTGLFTNDQLQQPNFIDLQDKYKEWHYETHGYHARQPHEKWGLQAAIHETFDEFLDKTETLNRWSRGLYLNRHVPKIQSMIMYAANDCLAVTKLCFAIDQLKFIS